MNLVYNETQRIIKETLRERGVDTIDQEFIINLFDSVIAILNMGNDLKLEDMKTIREEVSSHLLSSALSRII